LYRHSAGLAPPLLLQGRGTIRNEQVAMSQVCTPRTWLGSAAHCPPVHGGGAARQRLHFQLKEGSLRSRPSTALRAMSRSPCPQHGFGSRGDPNLLIPPLEIEGRI